MNRRHRPLGRPRQEEKSISTKDMILYAATEMFLDKGYPLVSMDDVANKCDVTKATVYYYYKTKSSLFIDAMLKLMGRIKEQIALILSTDKALKTQLFEIAVSHWKATIDIDINSFMKEAKISLTEEQLQQMEQAENEMYLVIEQALKNAMDKGVIPKSNAHLNALIFMSLLTVGHQAQTSQELDTLPEDTAEEIIDFYWNGLSSK